MRRPSPPLHFAQGLLMGGADVIPGVSGGTMALIVGIYERLLHSVSHVFRLIVSPLRGGREAARRSMGEIEWLFLLPLGAGIATAIVIGSKTIPGLMETYPEESRALFFGLVAASVAIPWMRMGTRTASHYALVPVAAAVAFVLVGLPPTEVEHPSLVRVFVSASVAICAMILPGVSGAFLLAVLGMYTVTLHALSDLDVAYILTFMAGAAVGLGLFSRLLDWLLEHRHDLTMAALVGLMLGSLRALWPWQAEDRGLLAPSAGQPVLVPVLLAFAGFVAVALLTWWGNRRMADLPPGHG